MAATRRGLGNRIAPPRFVAFALLMIVGCAALMPSLGWARGSMAAFDIAALIFFGLVAPLMNDEAEEMREAAQRNDANRLGLLVLTGIVMAVVMASVGMELSQDGKPAPLETVLIVGTLVIAWIFSNLIYALHYAHLFYGKADGGDAAGLDFPNAGEPDYWDFLYFSTCLGMTFQVSDVSITDRRIRRIVMFHSFAAFIYNLGVVAFTINVLGSG